MTDDNGGWSNTLGDDIDCRLVDVSYCSIGYCTTTSSIEYHTYSYLPTVPTPVSSKG